MEKENLYINDTSPSSIQVNPLPNCFLNLNWDNSMDQNSPFESALSSIVSSPIASNNAAPADIRELIGRLGSICNSPIMCGNNSTNNSCYTSPLNSPPQLNLSTGGNLPNLGDSNLTQPNSGFVSTDPGFAERAARFSCFGQFGLNETQFPYHQFTPRMENGKLSRVSSIQNLKVFGSQIIDEDEKESALQNGLEMDMRSAYGLSSTSNRKFGSSSNNALEASSGSKQISEENAGFKGPNDTNCRKRKAIRGKVAKDLSANDTKAAEESETNSKRSKTAENENVELSGSSINTAENGDQKQTKSNPKTPEPLKDYIHVRARRGQATDSHSLAKRVFAYYIPMEDSWNGLVIPILR